MEVPSGKHRRGALSDPAAPGDLRAGAPGLSPPRWGAWAVIPTPELQVWGPRGRCFCRFTWRKVWVDVTQLPAARGGLPAGFLPLLTPCHREPSPSPPDSPFLCTFPVRLGPPDPSSPSPPSLMHLLPPLTPSVFAIRVSEETCIWARVPGSVMALPIPAPGSRPGGSLGQNTPPAPTSFRRSGGRGSHHDGPAWSPQRLQSIFVVTSWCRGHVQMDGLGHSWFHRSARVTGACLTLKPLLSESGPLCQGTCHERRFTGKRRQRPQGRELRAARPPRCEASLPVEGLRRLGLGCAKLWIFDLSLLDTNSSFNWRSSRNAP